MDDFSQHFIDRVRDMMTVISLDSSNSLFNTSIWIDFELNDLGVGVGIGKERPAQRCSSRRKGSWRKGLRKTQENDKDTARSHSSSSVQQSRLSKVNEAKH
jgi:hypothetical protein